MFKIVEKTSLNPTVSKMVVEAPLIAKKLSQDSLSSFAPKKTAKEFR